MLLDLAAMTDCLSDLFRAVGFNATDPGSIKGKTFEAEVIRQATEAGFVTWECGRILKLDDDTPREIDASFIVGTTLFVVECKARSQNARVERGEYAAVKARWETLRDKHLGQAETLKNFLEANRTGRNYEIPDSVTTIEHCVCTPAAEWIHRETLRSGSLTRYHESAPPTSSYRSFPPLVSEEAAGERYVEAANPLGWVRHSHMSVC